MKFDETPVLEPRDGAALLAELRQRRASFVPEWTPADGDAGDGLLRIVSRYGQVIADRLNQAPDRSFLAFLDMLGISLIPAQPARAAVVFKPFTGMGDGRAPEGTRVGAKAGGSGQPIVFETERPIAIAGAHLTDVFSIWPDRDAYADHSQAATGNRPFTLFTGLQPIPHELYLAHESAFDVDAGALIEIAIDLAPGGSTPLPTTWQYWDGQVWQDFQPFASGRTGGSYDGTAGFTRSGTIALRPSCGRPEKTRVSGIEARWIRGVAAEPLPPDPNRVYAALDRARVRARVAHALADIALDSAYQDGVKLDATGIFRPFGPQAVTGSIFYLRNDEVFGKPGARVAISYDRAAPFAEIDPKPKVQWQYWNGQRWLKLADIAETSHFGVSTATQYTFTLPEDAAPTSVNGESGCWLRAQLVSGSYGKDTKIPIGTGSSPPTMTVTTPTAPILNSFHLAYDWRPPFQPVQHCCARNDFEFELHTRDVRWSGNLFAPFRPVSDALPAVYLGFDSPLPNDLVSIYLDVEERSDELPRLIWEAWNGNDWTRLAADDESSSLAQPGIVSFVCPAVEPRARADVRTGSGTRLVTPGALDAAPFRAGQLVTVVQGDKRESVRVAAVDDRTINLETPLVENYTAGSVAVAALPRFGIPRDWIRARLKENGAPAAIEALGVHVNAVDVLQTQTITGEVLGSGNGQPGQTLFFSQFPILPGEEIEVRELEGARAHVELPILRDELLADGFDDEDMRIVTDPRSGKVREVWVRWRPRPHLYFSSPTDRHYVLERARGRLILGDGVNGRLAAVGVENIRARVYRAGGGLIGNVEKRAIDQLLGGAFAEAVFNPRAASGGADGESPRAVKDRGPETLRHRWRALSASDYAAMALEASPGVAAVRVLPATTPNLRPAPGWVTVVIVPQSREPRPQPSLELRQQVQDYLVARTPATLVPVQVAIIGPTYRPVGVAALVVPRVPGDAGPVADRITRALLTFLHPLTGGPEGRGWDFGRDVFLSDVAAILEAVPGVDHVVQLDLLLGDAPVGARVEIPHHQIVVAGALRVEMKAGE